MIYLDNAATTKVADDVLREMLPYFSDIYGNAGSIHSAGRRAEAAMQEARGRCASGIGANPENIIFTSGGSEANSLAIMGVADYLKRIGKTHIITTQFEHHSVLECMKPLFYKGFEITYLRPNRHGIIEVSSVKDAIRQNTGLVSIMHVNNELGTMMDIESIGHLCQLAGCFFHTDCVQSYGQFLISVDQYGIDFLSASGHKINAPKGVGLLYTRCKEVLSPIIHGGSQEYGLRGGTENIAGIVGFGAASEIAFREDHRAFFEELRTEFLSELVSLKVEGFHLNGAPDKGSKIVNLRFDEIDGETLLLFLDSQGVMVSAGSACSAHSAVPSHVLTSIGLTDNQARSSIRVSFSPDTTLDEVKDAAAIIADTVKKLWMR